MSAMPVRETSHSISIIIPTKNRQSDLELTVRSIVEQSHHPCELIIVDQSAAQSFTKPVPFKLRYIHDPKILGLTAARNVAMSVASGEIWLFLDDDVVLEPNFLSEILRGYRHDVTGVSGIITNYSRPPMGRYFWDEIFMRGPIHDDRQRIYWNASHLAESEPICVRQFGGGLMSFRAEAIRTLRFDEYNRGAAPGEDIDFCAQLPKGSVLLINPKARLLHKKSPEARTPVPWLTLHAQVYYYMRERHWRKGIWNNLCFAWLNVGYALAASLSCLKRMSLAPWRAWREGAQKGYRLAHPESSASNPR